MTADSGNSRFGKRVFLILRCKSNKTELYIIWNDYLGNESDVLTRVGKAKATTRRWSLSTDSQSTFYPESPISFIKRLSASNTLVAQVTPYNESPVTAVFKLAGLGNAIAPLQQTCHWK